MELFKENGMMKLGHYWYDIKVSMVKTDCIVLFKDTCKVSFHHGWSEVGTCIPVHFEEDNVDNVIAHVSLPLNLQLEKHLICITATSIKELETGNATCCLLSAEYGSIVDMWKIISCPS